MTDKPKLSPAEIDAMTDRLERLIDGATDLFRRHKLDECILMLQEAENVAKQLPTKKDAP